MLTLFFTSIHSTVRPNGRNAYPILYFNSWSNNRFSFLLPEKSALWVGAATPLQSIMILTPSPHPPNLQASRASIYFQGKWIMEESF